MTSETDRFWAKVDKSGECWEWTAARARGYGRFIDRTGALVQASRFSWELANGPAPKDRFVCHHCDNRSCVRPSHLFLGAQTDNMQDARIKGRLRSGDKPHEMCKNGLHRLAETRHRGQCRPCHLAKSREIMARRRALRAESPN